MEMGYTKKEKLKCFLTEKNKNAYFHSALFNIGSIESLDSVFKML
jgi:hypothetical protein